MTAIGSLSGVIVYLYQRGEKRAEAEILRLAQQNKDLIAAHEQVLVIHEREKELLRKEVHDWQDRTWVVLNEFGKPAVAALQGRGPA